MLVYSLEANDPDESNIQFAEHLVQNELNGFDSWFELIAQLQQQILELDVRWN